MEKLFMADLRSNGLHEKVVCYIIDNDMLYYYVILLKVD